MTQIRPDRSSLRVLFLCTGNSCRSQMAEGWARHLLGDRLQAHSAGTAPTVVNPLAVQVMREVGVDISSQSSKSVNEFSDQAFDLVITLCDDARARCPIFPGGAKTLHVGFPDPASAVGSRDSMLGVFREVRDQIRRELMPVLEEEIASRGSHCR